MTTPEELARKHSRVVGSQQEDEEQVSYIPPYSVVWRDCVVGQHVSYAYVKDVLLEEFIKRLVEFATEYKHELIREAVADRPVSVGRVETIRQEIRAYRMASQSVLYRDRAWEMMIRCDDLLCLIDHLESRLWLLTQDSGIQEVWQEGFQAGYARGQEEAGRPG